MDETQTSKLPSNGLLWQESLHWQPTSSQTDQFQTLYTHVIAANRHLNLTRIVDPTEFLEKHLWDSLYGVMPWLSEPKLSDPKLSAPQPHPEQIAVTDGPLDGATLTDLTPLATLPGLAISSPPPSPCKVIDIGTGGGFPGIPVAIARPDWQITLLDSTRKKVEFLWELVKALELTEAKPLLGRAETVGQQRLHREHYDLALIRAVAGASVCAEYALPLLKLGAIAVLYRGQWTAAEAVTLESALEYLGGKLDAISTCTTPLTQGQRHCLYIRKIAPTPAAFPRAVGVPAKKPLA